MMIAILMIATQVSLVKSGEQQSGNTSYEELNCFQDQIKANVTYED